MTEHSSASIRPPKDWQDFERNARILFECILNDIDTQRNGRSGQPQHGVDIYGRKDGKSGWYGIQCKGKDTNLDGKVTEKELREEVEKSEKFSPNISHFILITTAPDDAAIQKVAREITEEKESSGNPLSVSVWGWGALEERISEYPRALQAFEPDASPYSQGILEVTNYTHEKVKENSDVLEKHTELLTQIQLQHSRIIPMTEQSESFADGIDKTLHDEIDGYRDLINNQQSNTALKLLERIKERVWDSASDRVKFRVETNIGSAKLYSSDEKEQEAAEHFLAALVYQPNDPKAKANVVLANLIKKGIPEAIRTGKEALALQEDNAEAASYLIQAYMSDMEVTDPLLLVPKAVHGSASVDLAITNFYRARDDDRWIETALSAEKRHPETDRIIQFACEAVLQNALSSELLSGQLPKDDYDPDLLAKAAEKMQKLWDKQLNGDCPAVDASLPHNLALLYRVLHKDDLAREVTFRALDKMPEELVLIKLASNFYRHEGDEKRAEELLSKFEEDLDVRLTLAEMKFWNNPNGLLQYLSAIPSDEITSRQRILVGALRVDAFLACKELGEEERIKNAEAECGILVNLFPGNVIVLQIHSLVLEARNKPEEMYQILTKAKDLVCEGKADFYERYILAKRFNELSKYTDAVDLLLDHVDLEHDSPPLKTLYFSLVNSDWRRQAYELLQKIPDEISFQPSYLGATINLHFRRGDYKSAQAAIEKLLSLKPNDLKANLNLVDVWLRKNDRDAIADFLEEPVEVLIGSSDEYLRLAALLERFGHTKRALELAYRTLLSNPHVANVQLAFMGLILLPSSENEMELSVHQVGIDTAFTLQNIEGQKDTYVIEDLKEFQIIEEAIPSGHPICIAALGKKVGDVITLSNNEEFKIQDVKHKYVYQLQKNMEKFNRRFPDNTKLQRFTIKNESENSLEPILSQVKGRHDSIQNAFDIYEQSSLPLEYFSYFLGGNVIDSWITLLQFGRNFKVCHGWNQERDNAKKNLDTNNKSGFVTDALTLHIIRILDILDVVVGVCGKVGVTETTIDIFRYRLEHLKSHGDRPSMTMYWRDGQYFRDEITPEKVKRAIQFQEDELIWILDNVEIIPAESPKKLSNEAIKIRGALSFDFLDPFLAAQGKDRLFVCEDYGYRKYAVDEFGLGVAWLQPVLMCALEEGLLSKELYSQKICQIAELGNTFTSLDAIDLSYPLFHDDINFELVSKALFGCQAELHSHVNVMIDTLVGIWSVYQDPPLNLKKATSILLRRLFFGEWKMVYKQVSIQEIKELVNPLKRCGNFNAYFSDWLRGHFIIDK